MAKSTEPPRRGDAAGPDRRSARRFMKSALAILGETRSHRLHRAGGRGALQDLTEVLLPALFHQGRATAGPHRQDHGRVHAASWRADTDGLAGAEALRVADRAHHHAAASSSTQDSINRGLTFYNDHLAESLPVSTPGC